MNENPSLLEPHESSAPEAPATAPEWLAPSESDAGWVDIRCDQGTRYDPEAKRMVQCNKLLMRLIAEPTKDGVKKAVKIGLDMKCHRCKEINYRVIVV